jgi:hypothetical protein
METSPLPVMPRTSKFRLMLSGQGLCARRDLDRFLKEISHFGSYFCVEMFN